MIRWTGLAPLEFAFPFPGSLTSNFLFHLDPFRCSGGRCNPSGQDPRPRPRLRAPTREGLSLSLSLPCFLSCFLSLSLSLPPSLPPSPPPSLPPLPQLRKPLKLLVSERRERLDLKPNSGAWHVSAGPRRRHRPDGARADVGRGWRALQGYRRLPQGSKPTTC